MKIDLTRFRETYFEEAGEHLAALESGLLELQRDGGDKELLNSVFRAAHSIKGGAGTFGLDAIARFTHGMESVLARLREGQLAVSPGLVSLLLAAVDTLKELVGASRAGHPEEVAIDAGIASLDRVLAGGAPAAPAAPAPAAAAAGADVAASAAPVWAIRFAPKPSFFFGGQDPLLLLRELWELGPVHEVEADLSRLPALADLDPEQCALGWRIRMTAAGGLNALRDVFLFVEDACELAIAEEDPVATARAVAGPAVEEARAVERRGGGERRAIESTSIRVSTEKVDALVDLLGELVIAQAMVNQIVAQFHPGRLHELREALGMVDRNTRELQDRVMHVRMMPMSTVFSRFPRLVHDLAQSFGKDIRLDVHGGDIELDKSVIERLSDPLTHLIRNSADHGIESVERRRAAGKPDQGAIALRALHEGGNVILEVEDDGGGLDLERIRAKAIAQGLLRAEDTPTEEQLQALIFEAGLSTATTVTDVSGRGVGMDVVRRNVEQIGGAVTVRSSAGHGTLFRIRLPLTLAILDGLSVRVGGETYVIPLLSIVESLRPNEDHVRPVLGRGELLYVRGTTLPFLRLARAFDHAGAVERPTEGIVMVLEGVDGRFGVLVDDVLGQCQVVVKNLESQYRKVEGVMGATIMGDGRVALILDVQGLSGLARRNGQAESPAGRRAPEVAALAAA